MTLDSSLANQLHTSAKQLFKLIDGFAQARVLVVGDLALDELFPGQVERICREAPVLILRHEITRRLPGGGANAVYNLAKLGAKMFLMLLVLGILWLRH
jgi:bifunctional ADP-heptose synthase (sugar kinase/adenylyltransferase)